MHRNTEDGAWLPLFPRIPELDAGNIGQNVDAYRRHSNLINDLFAGEGLGGNLVAFDRGPKFSEAATNRAEFSRELSTHTSSFFV